MPKAILSTLLLMVTACAAPRTTESPFSADTSRIITLITPESNQQEQGIRFDQLEELLLRTPGIVHVAAGMTSNRIDLDLSYSYRESHDGTISLIDEAVATFCATHPEIHLEER